MTQHQTNHDALREQVRARYAAAATKVTGGDGGCGEGCCGTVATAEGPGFEAERYATLDRDQLPDTALLASLGCGNPTAVADLAPGQTVLDLGSGGGIDVLLSARRVGPTGRVYGLDMTQEMLARARANAAEAGAANVDFRKGQIEAIPCPPPPSMWSPPSSHVGCIAGALSKTEYQAGLTAVGFTDLSVAFTHQVGDDLHSAIIRAAKPSAAS